MKQTLTLCATLGALLLSCLPAWAPNNPPCTPPSITNQPGSQTKCQGQSASFAVGATGTAPLTYQWRKNNSNISGATASNLALNNVQSSDAANYSVVVYNVNNGQTCSTISSSATLTVSLPPSITTQPISQTLCKDSTATFTVVASGTGLSYQWRKNGNNVSGATTTTLTLNHITSSDAATYSVVVNNNNNCSATSSGATLNVLTVDTDGDGLADCQEQQLGTDPTNPDTDYDGRSDGQEVADDTNPTDGNSVLHVVLGHWRFNNAPGFVGEQGQVPMEASNLQSHSTWSGESVLLGAVDSKLRYRDVEANAIANINCRSGSVRFWFKPSWSSSGSGPSHVARLIEVGHHTTDFSVGWWALSLNATGNALSFTTEGDGIHTDHFAATVSFTEHKWYQIVLTYGPTDSALYINSALVAQGPGVQHWPGVATRALGFRLGSGYTNQEQASGAFEELETFNYPLSSQVVRSGYQSVMQVDYDQDGLPDVLEDEIGTNPSAADTDGDGMPDGWEYTNLHLAAPSLNPMTAEAGNIDTDNDGRSNLQEYMEGTDPLHAEDRDPQITYVQAASAQDLINVDFTPDPWDSSRGDSVKGPAAAGFATNDKWNFFFGNSWAETGLANAGGFDSNVKLWAFAGPVTTVADSCFMTCAPRAAFASPVGYSDWLACWRSGLCCYLGTISSLPGCNYFYDWPFLFGSLPSYRPCWQDHPPDPDLAKSLLWLPGFDATGYSFTDWWVQGINKMNADALTTRAFTDGNVQTWPNGNFRVMQFVSDARVYLTGLTPSLYQVYVYGAAPTKINGARKSGRGIWWRGSSSGIYSACTRYTINVAGELNILSGRNLVTECTDPEWNDQVSPFWLPRGPRIALRFDPQASLAGLQIVRIAELQAPVNVHAAPGKRAVYVRWDRRPSADAYDVYRSSSSTSGFAKVGSTVNRTFADGNLAPGTTYYYYVVATNEFYNSPASATVSAIPFDAPGNSAPLLNQIKPIRLSGSKLPGGGAAFKVPFQKVLAASDARDMDGDPLTFRVEAVLEGQLEIDGLPFQEPYESGGIWNPGNCSFGPNSAVLWTPARTVSPTGQAAFLVRAFDGFLTSVGLDAVEIIPTPQTCLVGWGANEKGGLGNGDEFDPYGNRGSTGPLSSPEDWFKLAPTRVKAIEDVAKGDGGYAMGAAVTFDQKLWLWGDMWYGSYGEGCNGVEFQDSLRHIKGTPFQMQVKDELGQLQGFADVTDVSINYNHALAVKSDGSLWSWGGDDFRGAGVLGRIIPLADQLTLNGVKQDFMTKKPGQITGFFRNGVNLQELKVVQAVADYASNLALCEDGSVWWWGTVAIWQVVPNAADYVPAYQYLLQDEFSDHNLPNRQVAFDTGPKVVQIAAAGDHYMALREDGTVWEFGYVPRLQFGQPLHGLAQNTCGEYCFYSKDPVQVPNLPGKVQAIAACWDYSAALLEDGTVYHWGNGAGGPLPDPVQIPELKDVVQISGKIGHCLAIDKQGLVWAWGRNESGECGQPASLVVTSPKAIQGIENAAAVFVGSGGSFAVASLEEGKPSGLTAIPMNQKVRLDWWVLPGTSFYLVYRAEESGGPYTQIATTIGNSFNDTAGLENGRVYYYCVSAFVDGTETVKSREAPAVPLPPPARPDWVGLASANPAGKCRSIQLSWNAVPAAVYYKIERAAAAAGPYSLIKQLSAQAFADETALVGNEYYYRIFAGNTAGDSPSSEVRNTHRNANLCAAAPTITDVHAEGVDHSVKVTWTKVSSTGATPIPAEAYRVKWHYGHTPTAASPFSTFREIAVANLTDNGDSTYSYIFSGDLSSPLPENDLVWFKVSAILQNEEGLDSALGGPVIRCGCSPGTPANVHATAGFQQVFLEWDDDEKAEHFLVEHRVSGGTWSSLTVFGNRYWDENLVNGQTYEYRVTALGPNGVSPSSPCAIVTATPTGTAPVIGTWSAKADAYDSMIFLHWEELGLLTPPQQFQCFVERKTAGNPYEVISDTGVGFGFHDKQVLNGVAYTYRVSALDANFQRFTREVTQTPTANGSVGLTADAGNAHVILSWSPLSAKSFQVKHSLQPGGPYEILASVPPETTTYLHKDIENGKNHYYRVTVLTPFEEAIDSLEVMAQPSATKRPLPPANFHANQIASTIQLSWDASPGADQYDLRLNGAVGTTYLGPNNSFAFNVPVGTADGHVYEFEVKAGRNNQFSGPGNVRITYSSQKDVDGTAMVILTVAGQEITVPGQPIQIQGPTNLVLSATVKTLTGTTGRKVSSIHFYDGDTLVGTSEGPSGLITWFDVPKGAHPNVVAKAVDSPAVNGLPTSGDESIYTSLNCTVNVKLLPEVATFQTSATDLQLSAPGLPIVLSRAYDSRRTNANGVLGSGWTASWDEPSLVIANPLSSGWLEGGFNTFSGHYLVAESASHLITVTLPGGAAVYFSPQPTTQRVGGSSATPYHFEEPADLTFNACTPNQGSLSCDGAKELDIKSYSGNLDWNGDSLDIGNGAGSSFVPFSTLRFTYTSPDGTTFVFEPVPSADGPWKLTKITDRNTNSLTYTYDTVPKPTRLVSIEHSNHRKVQFVYEADGAGGTNINVFDSVLPPTTPNAVIRYHFSAGNFLKEVFKHTSTNNTDITYEKVTYNYGDNTGSANDLNRLTKVFDNRGVRVLLNAYGATTDSPAVPDGRLTTQTDPAGHVTSYAITSTTSSDVLNVTSGTGANEQIATLEHNASGAITKVKQTTNDPGTKLAYDSRGRLIETKDAYDKIKRVDYDQFDRPVASSDELGNTTSTDLNQRGQPLSATDANGNSSEFDYDPAGNPLYTVDSAGVRTDYEYWAPITLPGNSQVVLAAGLVAKEKRHAPGVSLTIRNEYTYYQGETGGGIGDLKQTKETWVKADGTVPDGEVVVTTTYEYDANGNRTKETRRGTVNGNPDTLITTTFKYDAQNRLFETTDPLLRKSYVTYNSLGKQSATKDVLGRVTSYIYDALGNLIETKYPDGTVTRSTYDEKNRSVYTQERSVVVSAATTAPATKNIYDAAGRVSSVERRDGVVLLKETANYPGLGGGNVSQSRMSVSSEGTRESLTRTQYDLNGRVQFSMDARGTVTENRYDDAGRRTSVLVFTNYTVTPLDTGTIPPSGAAADQFAKTEFGYDANGNQLWVKDHLGRQVDYVYDEANRVTEVWFPQVAGDAGRKSKHTVYDGLGRRVREIDEAGVPTGFTYDFRGLLTSVTLDAGKPSTVALTTYYEYDEAGNNHKQTDAQLRETRFEYDLLGRRTKRILPDNSFETIAYTDVEETTGSTVKVQQRAVTDFRNKTIVTSQDRLDRIKTKTLPAINLNESPTSVTYQYTDIGLLDQVAMSGQVSRTTYYAYDSLRRLLRKDTPEGVVAYTYQTGNGSLDTIKAYRRSAVSPPNAEPDQMLPPATPDVHLVYAYDKLGRLQTVKDYKLSTTDVTTYFYDPVGNLDSFTYPNGVKHAYAYTEQNRLKTLTISRGDTTLLRGYDYTLSTAGQRTGVTETHRPASTVVQRRRVSYEYDTDYNTPAQVLAQVNRLTRENLFDASGGAAGNIQHVYDKVGNRLQRTSTGVTSVDSMNDQAFVFDNRDQIGNFHTPVTDPAYDANGNSIKDENGTATDDKYDAENHLIQRGDNIAILYDHDGNRVHKSVTDEGTTTTTYYVLDDRNPSGYVQVLAEYVNTANAPTRAYTYGHDLVAARLDGTTTVYYGYDGHGSVRLLTSSATGAGTAITDTYDYDAYGQLLANTGTTPNNYRYTGEQWDGDLGMYHLRARYLNPNTGRFWTMDSYEGNSEDPLSLHKYLYCHANPANGIDPSGHENLISVMASITVRLNMAYRYVATPLTWYYRTKTMLDTVMAIKSVFEAFTDGGIATEIRKALRDTALVWQDISLERVMADLENNLFTRVAPIIAAHWPMKLAMAGENPRAIGIQMPCPVRMPKLPPLRIGKIPRADLDMYLIFGASGNRSGRVVGMELLLPKRGWTELWRMDSHGSHGAKGELNDLVPVWKSDGFHYHVKRFN